MQLLISLYLVSEYFTSFIIKWHILLLYTIEINVQGMAGMYVHASQITIMCYVFAKTYLATYVHMYVNLRCSKEG